MYSVHFQLTDPPDQLPLPTMHVGQRMYYRSRRFAGTIVSIGYDGKTGQWVGFTDSDMWFTQAEVLSGCGYVGQRDMVTIQERLNIL